MGETCRAAACRAIPYRLSCACRAKAFLPPSYPVILTRWGSRTFSTAASTSKPRYWSFPTMGAIQGREMNRRSRFASVRSSGPRWSSSRLDAVSTARLCLKSSRESVVPSRKPTSLVPSSPSTVRPRSRSRIALISAIGLHEARRPGVAVQGHSSWAPAFRRPYPGRSQRSTGDSSRAARRRLSAESPDAGRIGMRDGGKGGTGEKGGRSALTTLPSQVHPWDASQVPAPPLRRLPRSRFVPERTAPCHPVAPAWEVAGRGRTIVSASHVSSWDGGRLRQGRVPWAGLIGGACRCRRRGQRLECVDSHRGPVRIAGMSDRPATAPTGRAPPAQPTGKPPRNEVASHG